MYCIYYSSACISITVRVVRAGHFAVSGGVGQKFFGLTADEFGVCSHKFYGSCVQGFRPFGSFAHDKHGLAQAGGFLLYAAGIGQDDGGAVQ